MTKVKAAISKEILVNIGINETRVAILEEGALVELAIERPDEQRRAGNIYRGKVENVLPGMQAAFINIGEEKNAFLYIDDVTLNDPEGEAVAPAKRQPIQKLLRTGQEIIVQMIKEPIGTKGPRVVTQITIPGRYLVLIPTVDYIGISRRIEREAERDRLKQIVSKFKAPEVGLIVRTVAADVSAGELRSDYEFLLNVWKKIIKKSKKGQCPALVYRDHDLLYRLLRDFLSKDVKRLLIDDPDSFAKAQEMLKNLAPALRHRVQLYQGEQAIFEAFNVESQLEKALRRKVWLENGAYLIFDQAEALTVIDVNTGKFIGSTSLKDTVFKTNLAAVTTIARQIRLRNLAGIIVIDFIDMASDKERAAVIEKLQAELVLDKAKSNILGFTSLGLLEMTRKKVKQSLRELIQTECEFCEGTGYLLSTENYAQRALRSLKQIAHNTTDAALLVGVHPQVAALLIGPGGTNLEKIEHHLNKTIFIKGRENFGLEQVRLLISGSKAEIEFLALPVQEGEELELKILEAHIAHPSDGIARIEGYVINVEGAGAVVGKTARVVITKTYKTFAKARIID